jgi:predicted ATPase
MGEDSRGGRCIWCRAGLLERERELARIDGILPSARAGPGGLLLITGPAGIGKSRLRSWCP